MKKYFLVLAKINGFCFPLRNTFLDLKSGNLLLLSASCRHLGRVICHNSKVSFSYYYLATVIYIETQGRLSNDPNLLFHKYDQINQVVRQLSSWLHVLPEKSPCHPMLKQCIQTIHMLSGVKKN